MEHNRPRTLDIQNGQSIQRPQAAPAERTVPARTPRPKKNWLKIALLSLAGVVVALALLWGIRWVNNLSSAESSVNTGRYQAVFLTTGEVYFGKMTVTSDGYLRLADVFYIQKKASEAKDETNDLQQATNDAGPQVELIKLGSEIHGPEDAMLISKDQVLYFENLKNDGTVVKSIDKYHASKR